MQEIPLSRSSSTIADKYLKRVYNADQARYSGDFARAPWGGTIWRNASRSTRIAKTVVGTMGKDFAWFGFESLSDGGRGSHSRPCLTRFDSLQRSCRNRTIGGRIRGF